MDRKQYGFLAVLVVASGFVGGAVSGRLFSARAVYASEIKADPDRRPAPTMLSSQHFRLTDQRGKTRAVLGMKPHGSVALEFYDKKGKARLGLGLHAQGMGQLLFHQPDGTVCLGLTHTPEGSLGMVLQGKGGTNITLNVNREGSPGLIFVDNKGKARVILRLAPDGSPVLALQGGNGKSRAILGTITPEISRGPLPERPTSSLVLLDEKEQILWQAP